MDLLATLLITLFMGQLEYPLIVYVDVNGKTIHVVQRSPPSARAASDNGATSSAAEPGQTRGERRRMEGNSFVVGSFSIPPDATDVNQVHVGIVYTSPMLMLYCLLPFQVNCNCTDVKFMMLVLTSPVWC